ncbi:hypothetical protein BDW42DRAFT_192961 [Aspergillus taichungensis]|uniref:Mid2 domain-containing protein n=1 Tax=Aspergillus taichungensis TaxID=482145 RepID=A0A2J5HYX5_9EURO|nr:hypothetical protein BDW42DRAFT_192961 [Aspergillus taichungensis]
MNLNLKSITLTLSLLLTTTNALVLPNPPYALSSKSTLPSSTTNNPAIDITSTFDSTSYTNTPPTTMATAIPIPIEQKHEQSEYDLERMSLPLLKSTLQTCDVVFAVVALVLLVPGLVVVLFRGWNYLKGSSEGDSYEGEGEGLLGGYGKGGNGSVMNQIENGDGNGIVRNEGRTGDGKKMVGFEEV